MPLGDAVHGTIDWDAALRSHAAAHRAARAVGGVRPRCCGARTESFHLGADSRRSISARELSAAGDRAGEDEANRVVWEDRPVTIRFADAEDAAALPLRKESKREGTLRLIDVEDFDLSACGGTHVARTGAIGIIAVAATERFRGGTRVTFLCGGRALTGYRALRDAVAGSVRVLCRCCPPSCPPPSSGSRPTRRNLRRQVKDFQSRVAAQEADALADRRRGVGSVRLVAAALTGWDAAGLKTIASRVVERRGHLAVLLSDPAPAAVVIARAADLPHDAGALLRAIVARHGGKGGGPARDGARRGPDRVGATDSRHRARTRRVRAAPG